MCARRGRELTVGRCAVPVCLAGTCCHSIETPRGTNPKVAACSAQARHDPVDVRNLIAAEPPNVGRAGQLLFKRPPVFVGRGWRLAGDAEDGRHRQAQDYAVHWHVRSFPVSAEIACSAKRNGSIAGLKMNAAREGSANSKQCEDAISSPYSTLPIFFTAAIRRAESSATNLENSGASI
jgi:hypothetical protein